MASRNLRRSADRALRSLLAAVLAATPTLAHAETRNGTARSDYIVGDLGASRITAAEGKDVVIGDPAGRKVTGIRLLSTNAAGEKANAPSFTPAFSADGRFLAFASKATNLDPSIWTGGYNQIFVKDLASGAVTCLTCGPIGDSFAPVYSTWPSRSGRGLSFMTFARRSNSLDTNGFLDTYSCVDATIGYVNSCDMRYLASDGRRRVGGGGSSVAPSYPYFGGPVHFVTSSSNLSLSDTDTRFDVYRSGLSVWGEAPTYVSIGPSIIKRDTYEIDFNVAGDVAVSTNSLFVVPGAEANRRDVFVTGAASPGFFAANVTARGVTGNGPSEAPRLTPLGRKVVFVSRATNLDPRDTTNDPDLYVKDLDTGALALVSRGAGGRKGNAGASGTHRVSPDGSLVVYVTAATNIDARDRDTYDDCYVNGVAAPGTPTLIHVNGSGVKGAGSCATPVFSPDGRQVAFSSTAAFDARDRDGFGDIYAVSLGDQTKTGIAGDTLFGGKDDDLLFAGPGDDVITPGIGNDLVDGGTGVDRARYTGDPGDYTVTAFGNGWYRVVDSMADAEGDDILHAVEYLSFGSLDVALSSYTTTLVTSTVRDMVRYGTPIPLDVQVVGATDGTVRFTAAGRELGTARLTNGRARWNTPTDLALGENEIVATFLGTANRQTSSGSWRVVVTSPVALAVTVTPTTVTAGDTLRIAVRATTTLVPSVVPGYFVATLLDRATLRRVATASPTVLVDGRGAVSLRVAAAGAYGLYVDYYAQSVDGEVTYPGYDDDGHAQESVDVDVAP